MKRWLSLLLCVLFLFPVNAMASSAGLDRWLQGILGEDGTLEFQVSLQLSCLKPYPADTVEMMNALLRHLAMSGSIGEEQVSLRFLADGGTAAELTEAPIEQGMLITTDLLPGRGLVSSSSVLEAETEEDPFDLSLYLEEIGTACQKLKQDLLPATRGQKASYKIKGIGKAGWKQSARLTVEESAAVADSLRGVLMCGMDAEYRGLLGEITFSKALEVTLYSTEQEGQDIALSIKGRAAFADGYVREIEYLCAFSEENGLRSDLLEFSVGRTKKPASERNVSVLVSRDIAGTNLSGTAEYTLKADKTAETVITDYSLSGTRQQNRSTVSGTVTLKTKTTENGESVTSLLTAAPDLAFFRSSSGTAVTGRCSVSNTVSGRETMGFELIFALPESPEEKPVISVSPDSYAPDAYQVGEAPVGYTVYKPVRARVDLDTADDETLQALLDEAAQNLAGQLLIRLAALPREDTALLWKNMTEEDYVSFMNWLNTEREE